MNASMADDVISLVNVNARKVIMESIVSLVSTNVNQGVILKNFKTIYL